ncbi:MAG: hypothetical protein WAX07_04635 [Candidatus Altiarchaeia archaeon]
MGRTAGLCDQGQKIDSSILLIGYGLGLLLLVADRFNPQGLSLICWRNPAILIFVLAVLA